MRRPRACVSRAVVLELVTRAPRLGGGHGTGRPRWRWPPGGARGARAAPGASRAAWFHHGDSCPGFGVQYIMLVEPMAGNLNPVGRVYSAGSVLCCVPNALSQGGPALGTIATDQALGEAVTAGGF